MQRTIVMIRHAKSSWANPLQSDFERPLTDRGKNDAEDMGKRLRKNEIKPDLIISSTAKRTRQTAKRIAKELGYDEEKIRWEEKLYHCIPSVFEELLYEVDGKAKTVAIVAHNPGITDFVNQLAGNFVIDNMPTCGIVAARMDIEDWSDFPNAPKEVFLFEHPEK